MACLEEHGLIVVRVGVVEVLVAVRLLGWCMLASLVLIHTRVVPMPSLAWLE